MKFLFAPDSYKGTLSAVKLVTLMEASANKCYDKPEIVQLPVADGGEGTVDALIIAMGGSRHSLMVTGPLFDPVEAIYGLSEDGETAFIEMASTSGLPLCPTDRRNPLYTTSRGLGELMVFLMEQGIRKILLGVGGSATNDGGMGAISALGVRFSDKDGRQVRDCGEGLSRVCSIDLSGIHPLTKSTEFTIICDVSNPLLGPSGATYVYGPQKGADADILKILESGMENFSSVFKGIGIDIASFAGAGAAGGLGGGLKGVLGATLKSGIDAVLDAADFEEKLKGVDLVITGEGRMDGQSIRFGKVPTGVARRAAACGVPTIAIVGGMGPGAEEYLELGETSIMTTIPDAITLKEALEQAEESFKSAADRLFRILKIGSNIGH